VQKRTRVLCEGLLMLAHSPVYHPREPTDSPLWKILHNHYEDFNAGYGEHCEKQYGFFRPVVDEVVEEYLRCGDLHEACPELVEGALPGCAAPTPSANMNTFWRYRPHRTAGSLSDPTLNLRITHAFHPLFSNEYRLVEFRRVWGREQAVFYDENDDLTAVPVDWTDLAEPTDPFVILSEGRAWARPADLLALSALIQSAPKRP
jgi:hypothetical protein